MSCVGLIGWITVQRIVRLLNTFNRTGSRVVTQVAEQLNCWIHRLRLMLSVTIKVALGVVLRIPGLLYCEQWLIEEICLKSQCWKLIRSCAPAMPPPDSGPTNHEGTTSLIQSSSLVRVAIYRIADYSCPMRLHQRQMALLFPDYRLLCSALSSKNFLTTKQNHFHPG